MNPKRSKILSISLIFVFTIVAIRFFYWQIIRSPDLKEKALDQIFKLETIIPKRGNIYSSDGFPLAIGENAYKLSIYKPNLKEDINNIFQKIDQIHPNFLQDNQNLVNSFINNQNQKWLTFPTFFEEAEKNKIDFDGVTFQKTNQRFYPENSLAKNLLGFVAKDSQNNDIGYGGLEAYYDRQLKGKTGFTWSPQDATGKTILTRRSWISSAADGRNLHTNINRQIQLQVEKTLQDGIDKYQADSGSIIIMNPQTGGIIAASSITATSSATPSASKNPAISDLFEPGSIFKPLVVTMALDKKSIDTDFICTQCNQSRTIGQYTITNWDNALHPDSSLQDIIKNSDNIGMSYIISHLGLNNFLDYYKKLGLNQKTGIDLQGESKPTVKSNWPEIDLATASFGQGVVVTQMSMLQAFNTIANNGYLVQTHVVNSITDSDNQVLKIILPKQTLIFGQDSINKIKSILKYAVENGVVSTLKPKNLEVCAKSGTAQVAISGHYDNNSSTIASYIGFSPCNDPKFTMIVTINNPKSSPWGSSTAAPIWFELAPKITHLL